MPEVQNVSSNNQQPGSVITPGSSSIADQPTATPVKAEATAMPENVVLAAAEPAPHAPDQQYVPTPVDVPQQFDASHLMSQQAELPRENLSWVATEYISHHKSSAWYGLYAIASIAIIGFVYLITKAVFSAVALGFGSIILAIYAGKKPNDKQYQLDGMGFSVGDRRYEFSHFRSFSTVHEGDVGSLIFTPLKRFGAYTTIYYSAAEEDDILDIVEEVLPFVEYHHDVIDRLVRKIRF